jgi:transcriptional regulator with XRE-family HTH domain
MGDPSLTLRRLREMRGLTLRDLGKASGVSFSVISRAENGHLEDTSFGTVKAVCAALGVTIDELYRMDIEVCPSCNGQGWVMAEKGSENGNERR